VSNLQAKGAAFVSNLTSGTKADDKALENEQLSTDEKPAPATAGATAAISDAAGKVGATLSTAAAKGAEAFSNLKAGIIGTAAATEPQRVEKAEEAERKDILADETKQLPDKAADETTAAAPTIVEKVSETLSNVAHKITDAAASITGGGAAAAPTTERDAFTEEKKLDDDKKFDDTAAEEQPSMVQKVGETLSNVAHAGASAVTHLGADLKKLVTGSTELTEDEARQQEQREATADLKKE